MGKIYKAHLVKKYFNWLPDELLYNNIVVHMDDKYVLKVLKNSVSEITLMEDFPPLDIAKPKPEPKPKWEFKNFPPTPPIEERYTKQAFESWHQQELRKDPKSDTVDKLRQMALDSIHEALSSLQENNNDMSIFHLDKAINSIKCKVNVQYGNSPWDPR